MGKETWTNNLTGEVKEFTEGETFVMLRTTDGTSWVKGLSATDFMVFFESTYFMSKQGYLSMSKSMRDKMSANLEISERSVRDSLARLVQKNLMLKLDGGGYLVNPEMAFKFHARHMWTYREKYYAIKRGDRKR